jgi:hypothetical protein
MSASMGCRQVWDVGKLATMSASMGCRQVWDVGNMITEVATYALNDLISDANSLVG